MLLNTIIYRVLVLHYLTTASQLFVTTLSYTILLKYKSLNLS